MISPTRVVAAVCGAMLCALPFDGRMVSAAAAGPTKGSTQVAATAAVPQPPDEPHPRAYLFRGAMGPIFSRGMDSLGDELEEAGITAPVYEFTICRLIAAKALREYRESPAPIVLIGHSMGGFCAIKFAEILEAENIRVSLIVSIDPAHVTPEVPFNVDRFINIFLSKDVLGGGDVKPKAGFPGHYASYDLSQHDEVVHINIEKMDLIHRQLVEKVLQLTKVKAEGETLPLRFVVPAGVPIELWDSGMPVSARSGDTLQSIADAYHVPLWSIMQVNKGAEHTSLVPGERIVVPRHLMPPVEVSEPVPPKPPEQAVKPKPSRSPQPTLAKDGKRN